MNWGDMWAPALPYAAFLDRHAEPRHQERWQRIYEQAAVTDEQHALLASFTRRMYLLCVAGAWCGDCVLQGPVLQRLAEAAPAVELRFLDRDAHPAAQDALMLNAGRRVPVVVFLSDDFEECSRYGDRTISMYRRMAQERLGPACATGIVPPADTYVAAVTADWMTEVERVQLMLRLSPRLRALHGD
jgi:thiol-disulfide isomerase/thioredoxin